MHKLMLRPTYVAGRLRQKRFLRQHPGVPWLTASSIILLESWLKPTDVGIEWGSGRSTVWFARRMGKLLSIEDNKQWYDSVVKMLAAENLGDKVDYRFVACTHTEMEEPESAPYADAADLFPDESVDFALVDGNIRVTCMNKAIKKLKRGGLLVLDNANRYLPNVSLGGFATILEPRQEPRTPGWKKIYDQLSTWRAILTTDGISDTRMWVKV